MHSSWSTTSSPPRPGWAACSRMCVWSATTPGTEVERLSEPRPAITSDDATLFRPILSVLVFIARRPCDGRRRCPHLVEKNARGRATPGLRRRVCLSARHSTGSHAYCAQGRERHGARTADIAERRAARDYPQRTRGVVLSTGCKFGGGRTPQDRRQELPRDHARASGGTRRLLHHAAWPHRARRRRPGTTVGHPAARWLSLRLPSVGRS